MTKKLRKNWTAGYTDPLTNQLAAKMADKIAEEIDWKIMSDMLRQQGWISCKANKRHSYMDIKEWATAYCTGKHQGRADDWLLSNEKDVTLFILKWST